MHESWDYLVVTASNAEQAAAYESQLQLRRELGFLSGVREVIVVADPEGRRVGSGGSTICCLLTVLNREAAAKGAEIAAREEWEAALRGLRILIVHAGGDSKRLPAYGPCGKIFIPVPGESDSALCTTLFDRQIPTYLALPPNGLGRGQIVITSGDVLLGFEPARVSLDAPGITGLACYASPEQASRHGVFCPRPDGSVRFFLQKPSVEQQRELGAVDRYERSVLDIGVMSFDAATAAVLLSLCGAAVNPSGALAWSEAMGQAILQRGLDFYGEFACALGDESTLERYAASAHGYGSTWDTPALSQFFEALRAVPFHVQILKHCSFLHFGAAHQIISSGVELLRQDRAITREHECLSINNELTGKGAFIGADAWVEGCRAGAEVRLEGGNVLVGVDVTEPLTMPRGACLDVLEGVNRRGEAVCFVRCYKSSDDFKGTLEGGAAVCGLPIQEFLQRAQAWPEDVWEESVPLQQRAVWNARLFPAESDALGYRRWLWMMEPATATDAQWAAWRAADRYSNAEIAERTNQGAFHERRRRIRAGEILRSLPRMLRPESALSAAELLYALRAGGPIALWLAGVVHEAYRHHPATAAVSDLDALNVSRVLHSLGTVVAALAAQSPGDLEHAWAELGTAERDWLAAMGLDTQRPPDAEWGRRAQAAAFDNLGKTITGSGVAQRTCPRNALRKDEIVWGRAPARLDLGGGWTDTPPYALERGGCVINAAIELNGQAPIQAYARVIDAPVIRLASIDFGERVEVTELDQLLDFRRTWSQFSLPKAALAISGFAPDAAPWPEGITLRAMLEHFGGGIELTTLAAIPGGSGLGTSSIVGAVVLAVVQRIMGRTLSQRELFHGVLRLEQSMTTGGGWQDQIGGVVGRVKIITAPPGLVPDPLIHFVPAQMLDGHANGGCTLLYYTGITRLAKNILQNVVGRYLNRERAAMATLERIHAFPARVADAMARHDLEAFGRALAAAWELKKQIDPGSTNGQIEALLQRMAPRIHGAKLMGAGGGGFLLLVCKSPEDARALRADLEKDPPNARARFFDFGLSNDGLVVTVC